MLPIDPIDLLGAIIAIGLLIIVHEAGHYVVAKLCKMRVERFSLGFGPALIGWRRNETLFQIAPIPFGGFVEIRGMNIAEDVDPDDAHAYPNRPAWQRFVTIFAGPATNYLFAMVLSFFLFSLAGVKTGTAWIVISEVHQEFDAYGKLLPGDRVVSIERPGDPGPIEVFFERPGKEVRPLSELVHESRGEPIEVVVLRGGERLPIQIRARPDPNEKHESTGEPRYRLGVTLSSEHERVRSGLIDATAQAVYHPVAQARWYLGQLYDVITRKQDPNLAGPVGITDAMMKVLRAGWIAALEFLIFLNIAIGLVNLLPLPALDGGRLVFLIYEMATRRRANPKIEATVHMVGIMALLLLMVVVTYKDCARLIAD